MQILDTPTFSVETVDGDVIINKGDDSLVLTYDEAQALTDALVRAWVVWPEREQHGP